MTSNHYKGIFFDAGNTLLRVHPSIGVIYSEAAKAFGVELAAEHIEDAFKELWTQTAPLVANEGHRLTFEKEREWWKHIVREVFKDHFTDFDGFFDYLFDRFAQSDCWRLYEDVIEVLETLRKQPLKLAIISNWDSRLPSLCDQLEITRFFDSVVVSAMVGYEKPHPRIFEIALEQTKLQPHEVLYIGDDPYLDYHAARKVGMHALHLDRYGRFEKHADKITSLLSLIR